MINFNLWNTTETLSFSMHIYIFIACMVFGNVVAIRIGYGQSGKSNIMINTKRMFSILLLLYPIRKVITIWAIILQVLNIINFITYIIIFKFFNTLLIYLEPKFRVVFSCAVILILLCVLIDIVSYELKHKYD